MFPATRKRFYRNTGIIQNEKQWEVTLDQRRLKTPNGRVLIANSEPLARAIAAEWDAQKDIIVQPTMHLVKQILLSRVVILNIAVIKCNASAYLPICY